MIAFPPAAPPPAEPPPAPALNPCPFCGSAKAPRVQNMGPEAPHMFAVHCNRCMAYGPGRFSLEGATRHWNVRSPSDRAVELAQQDKELKS